nr:MAG TPA: minor tail protein [Caudoviricetes sp.]
MAVKNLLIRGGADFSGVKKELNKAQKNISGFQKNVNGIMSKIKFTLGAIGIGALVKESTKAAMSVESSVDNINRTMQNYAKSFGEWVKTQSQSYGMSIQEGYKYGSTYSNLISSFQGDTKAITDSTQELMKATGIIASKTGRTFEDTAERIRSGMLGSTEAIEDLGVYTQVSMLESTEAFKQLADGKTWAQLNFQTQQQIRLAAILEQTYARYGTTLADTTQTRHNQFIASLKNVQLTLGQAFLPIYNAILPPLTTFISALGKAISVIAQFTTALFGKPKAAAQQTQAISNQASAVGGLGDSLDSTGDSANKAKKALKSLAGIDEINTLNQDTDNSSGSGGAGGIGDPLGNLDMSDGFLSSVTEVSDKIQKLADKIKSTFKVLRDFIVSNKKVIISSLAGIGAAFTSYFVMSNWAAIIGGIKGAFVALGAVIGGISLPIVAISALIGLLVGNIVYLWQTNEGFRNSVIEVWNSLKEFINTVVTDIGTILTSLWQEYGETLIDNLKDFMLSIQKIITNIWEGVIKPIVSNALEMLTWLWNNHLKGLVEELGKFIMKLTNFVLELWNNFIGPIVNFLVDILAPIFIATFNLIVDSIGTAVGVIADIIKGLLRAFEGLIDFISGVFSGNWARAWQGIVDIFGGIFDGLVGVVRWPLNIIIDLVNSAISGINSMIRTINKVPGINIPSVPKIPKLAKGGIIDSPTIAMVGEAGKEAVMPLENNTGWITDLAEKVSTRMPQGSGEGSNGDLILQIDGSVIGKVALKQLRRMQRQGNITLIPV